MAPLKKAGHVGDILWHPYSKSGPLTDMTPRRAVTLFDLPALVNMAAHKHKHVVLVAGPCHSGGERKAIALRPLMTVPELRAFDTLVTDYRSVWELLAA